MWWFHGLAVWRGCSPGSGGAEEATRLGCAGSFLAGSGDGGPTGGVVVAGLRGLEPVDFPYAVTVLALRLPVSTEGGYLPLAGFLEVRVGRRRCGTVVEGCGEGLPVAG